MNIIGKKVYLRAMESEDMDMLWRLTNDPETERLLGGWSFPVAKCEQMDWYQNSVRDKKNLRLTIVERQTERPIGMANIVSIDWKNGSAFHGMRLGTGEIRGRGFGTDTVMTIMKYAFEELRLNRLDSSIVEYNTISQEMYKKCGWKIEGVKKQALFREGNYFDLLITGILAQEYYEVKDKLGYN